MRKHAIFVKSNTHALCHQSLKTNTNYEGKHLNTHVSKHTCTQTHMKANTHVSKYTCKQTHMKANTHVSKHTCKQTHM